MLDYMKTATGRTAWEQATIDPAQAVADSVINIENALKDLPAKVAMQMWDFVRRRCDANESRILADRFEAGATDSDVEDMIRSENNTSKSEAKKRARRAKATNANPDLADRMSDGTMSPEQVDVIADAAADTDGEAACDEELIDDVAATSPEQGKKKARSYVNKRRDGEQIQREHDRQRRRRSVYRYRTKDGDHVLAFQGDKTSIDQMERRVNAGADDEYKADGGRDVSNLKHRRTNDQRRFDAAHKLICDREATNKKRSKDARGSGAIIVVTTAVDLKDPKNAVFQTADGATLPRSVVEDLMWDASWIGQIYSTEGALLWQGRAVRHATPAQITGLIARDGGCVQCGAHFDRCEAHHIDPWEAPIAGETNIDRLALLCKHCHTELHRRKRTLYFDKGSRSWKTRKARWEEIPPENPNQTHRKRQPAKEESTKPTLVEQRRNRHRHDPNGSTLTEKLF